MLSEGWSRPLSRRWYYCQNRDVYIDVYIDKYVYVAAVERRRKHSSRARGVVRGVVEVPKKDMV